MGASSAPCLHNNGKPNRCYTEVVTGTGYCKQHQPEPYLHNHYGEGLPKDFRRTIEAVMRRDKGICYLCGGKGADTVDHVIPRHLGGSDRMYNLKPVHDSVEPHCHREKSNREANEARAQFNTAKRRTR